MSFAEATAVTGGPGTWEAELEEGWDILGVTNGGYIAAIATSAMEAETGGRRLISANASFVNPARSGPIEIHVEILKEGRNLTVARAKITKEGTDLVYTTGVFADPERPVDDSSLILGSPPELPPPEECIRAEPSTDARFAPPFVGKVDLRIHPDDAASLMGARTGRPLIRGWFRLTDGEPLGPPAIVLAVDAFPPAIFNADIAVGWTPTVDLTVQVREPAPAGWLAGRLSSRFITGGMVEEDGEIWDGSGNLVALSRQLALVPR